MIWQATPRAFAGATIIAWALLLGVVTDRAELFIAAIPLAIGFLSLDRRRPPRFELRQEVAETRLSEGDRVTVRLTVAAIDALPMIELFVPLPRHLRLADGSNRTAQAIAAGHEASWSFEVLCPTRGRFDLGVTLLRLWDPSGLGTVELRIAEPRPIAVYPASTPLRRVPQPSPTQNSFGNYVSARVGDGIEPGDIRPFLPGDRVRHVNWRASLRRGNLYVTRFHEERNADIVLLLDTLAESGAPPGSTLDLCVRAAASLANAYLLRKDRVGYLEFGGFLRWIRPATGRRQGELLANAFLPAAAHFSYVVPRLDRLPPRILPANALVIALTAVLDERFVAAIVDLAERGFDVIVLALSPVEPVARMVDPSPVAALACRLWAIDWRIAVDALRRRGLTVIEWQAVETLEATLGPVIRARPRREGRR